MHRRNPPFVFSWDRYGLLHLEGGSGYREIYAEVFGIEGKSRFSFRWPLWFIFHVCCIDTNIKSYLKLFLWFYQNSISVNFYQIIMVVRLSKYLLPLPLCSLKFLLGSLEFMVAHFFRFLLLSKLQAIFQLSQPWKQRKEDLQVLDIFSRANCSVPDWPVHTFSRFTVFLLLIILLTFIQAQAQGEEPSSFFLAFLWA